MKAAIKSLVAGTAVVAVLALAPSAAPAFMGDDGPAPGSGHFKQMVRDLQLTQQQRQQVKDIIARNRPQGEPLMKQMQAERIALRSLIQADTVDEAAIREQSARVAAVEADIAVHRAHVEKEIRGVLTPEQITKQKEIQAQRDRGNRPGRQGKRGL